MANNCWIGYENMVVGEARAERNIIYTSTGAGVSFHHHVRGNEHAKRAAIRPGESIEMRRNVIAAGPSTWDGTGLVQFTNALKEKGDVFERPFDGYRAEGNWYFHPGVRRFKYVVEIDKVDEMLDLAGWKRKWGERERDALWVDPGFVDPAATQHATLCAASRPRGRVPHLADGRSQDRGDEALPHVGDHRLPGGAVRDHPGHGGACHGLVRSGRHNNGSQQG